MQIAHCWFTRQKWIHRSDFFMQTHTIHQCTRKDLMRHNVFIYAKCDIVIRVYIGLWPPGRYNFKVVHLRYITMHNLNSCMLILKYSWQHIVSIFI